MTILGEKGISGLVKFLLDFMFYAGFVVCGTLPWSIKWYLNYDYPDYNRPLYWYVVILLFISGVAAIALINEVRKIFKTINRNDPFVLENVRSLKNTSRLGFVISILFLTKVLVVNTLMTMAIVIVFFVAALACQVLAEVFRQAVIYKQENDFTI